MNRKFLQFLMLAALVAVTSVAMADPPARVGRVTVTEGRVTMLVDGEEETGNLMNWPVTTDNHLTTAPGARSEFRVGSTAVRLDGDSDIEVVQLDDDRLALRLNYGTASVRVRDPGMLNQFELTTPQARITLAEPGSFRVDTERAPDTTVVNVFGGMARVEGAGNMINARSGKRVEVRGDDIFSALAMRDSFDDWVADRDRREQNAIASRYVPAEMTGYEDLDSYGNWIEDREYGTVWFPRAVPVGWAPYRDGRWVWISPWGWTWVDNSPWGYAPFHYGRWVMVGGRWCWTPGRFVGRPVYSPALVGWVGGNNWSVSFSSGHPAPAVGWYPLTPHDRYVPAYRVSADYERRLVWNHRTNEHWHERFPDRDHDGRRDGVTALPRDQFDRSRNIPVSNIARITPQDVRKAPLVMAPPQLGTSEVRPQRQDPQRQPLLQTQPQLPQPHPQLRQPQQPDEHDTWRGRNVRDEQQRRPQITTAPQQPTQLQAAPAQVQLQAQPPRIEQQHFDPRQDLRQEQRLEQRQEPRFGQQRFEQQRFEQQRMEQQRVEQQRMEQQRMEQQRAEQQRAEQQRVEQQRMDQQRAEMREREAREERGRREAAQMQMAPARQPQVQMQAAPVQQAQPQQSQPQHHEQQDKRREERRENRRDEDRR